MAIKLSALRDRRPKVEPVEVELPDGDVVKFVNPVKRKGEDGIQALQELKAAENSDDMLKPFRLLAENGESDLEKFYANDATLEDIIDVLKEVSSEFEKQTGTLGE